MNDLRAAAQMALDALEHLQTDIDWQYRSPTRAMLRKVEKELRARLAQDEPEPMSCSVRFLRHTQKHDEDWIIDPAFLLRVYHATDPNAHYNFIPTMEEIETTLLALEVIPSNLYTALPQREWQGLTDDDIAASMTGDPIGGTALMSMMRDEVMLTQVRQAVQRIARAIEQKLKEKNT